MTGSQPRSAGRDAPTGGTAELADDLLRRNLSTRRQMLRRAGLMSVSLGTVPAVLSACGGNSSSADAGGRLDMLSWEGYDLPKTMKAWKKKHDITLKATYIANNNDIPTKLKGSGGAGFDLTTYYQGYKPLYDQLGILQPLDSAKIPNLSGLLPYFAEDENQLWTRDGVRTGVPWQWGSVGITYDSAKTPKPASWFDLLDPKFKGKVAVVDDPTGSYTLAARILGLDPEKVTRAQYAKVKDFLGQIVAQSSGISPSFGDMTTKLVSGDAVVAFEGWNAMDVFARDAGSDTIRTNLAPKEGGFSFCDGLALAKGADNADAAYLWMNEVLRPRTNADAAIEVVGGVTVTKAVRLLPENIASLYPYDRLDEIIAQSPFYLLPPEESDTLVTVKEVQDGWQEIKSSAKT